MNIYAFEDYKDFLRENIRKNSTIRGYNTNLAKAAGCQKSYLSQVIKSNVHLTPEHAIGVALFWNLNELESEYFLQLVHLGRTSYTPLKNKIKTRLGEIKEQSENLSLRYSADSLTDEFSLKNYYSYWLTSALHIVVDIEKLRTVDAISKYFCVPEAIVRNNLEELERLGLVKRDGGQWLSLQRSIHLSKNSPFN
ncbi:MAG: TIGR02147 family protein, partial [Bdellovibrionales bacterium]